MAITLRIDNQDQMPDGGPTEYSAGNRGFEIGREQHLDWTLPDPNRIVSSQHCRVTFEGGQYMLYDVSRNGTFVNGSPSRVRSPYQLANGDRLQIGHYLINVSISQGGGAGNAFPQQHFEPPPDSFVPPADSGDIWSTGGSTPEAVDRKWFVDEQRRGRRAPDPLQNFVELPRYVEPIPASESPFGNGPGMGNGAMGTGISPQLRGAPGSQMPDRTSAGAVPDYNRAAPIPQSRMPDPGLRVAAATAGGGNFLAAFSAASGIPPEAFAQRSPEDVATELGGIIRIVAEQLNGLLKARAQAKLMAKSANRTMVGPANNNALKLAPTPAEALAIMFERRRSGYLDATKSILEGFEDIKSHEYATVAAMQKALHQLTEDLSPDQIEDKAGGGAFGAKKARAWEIYVERWNAKTEHYENGILDLFLEYFGTAYDAAAKRGSDGK